MAIGVIDLKQTLRYYYQVHIQIHSVTTGVNYKYFSSLILVIRGLWTQLQHLDLIATILWCPAKYHLADPSAKQFCPNTPDYGSLSSALVPNNHAKYP
ncbi:hypothetical protein VNO77_26869 [Canavalia gladiata]|uniref:Uncharacterized protein n=1 Tax=Canavalia gladiata TaxID=3824 RepID=A0AAN9KTM4_CANGL